MNLKITRYQLLESCAPLIGFLAAGLILLIIIILVGESPAKTFSAIYSFTFKNAAKTATILSNAIPLFLSGLAVAFAFRAGVFNIGVEGQYFIGGLTGALAGIYLPLPAPLHIPVVVLFSMAGGALWAAVPAFMKVRKGLHEVITTIMFNNIAVLFVNFLVNGPLSGLQGTANLEPQTEKIRSTALFGKLNAGFRALGWNVPDYVYLDYSLIVAVLMGVVVWLILYRFMHGFEIRATGAFPEVAACSGINTKTVQFNAFLFSGALAGLVGLQEIFAIKGFYTFEITSGLGADGIAIALIGQNNPIGVFFAALLFSFLKLAGYGMQNNTSIPNAVISVITGLMIIIIVVTQVLVKRYVRKMKKTEVSA